jgi:hypothetical protein
MVITRDGKSTFYSQVYMTGHDLGEIVICTSFFSYGSDEGIGLRSTIQEDGHIFFFNEGYSGRLMII